MFGNMHLQPQPPQEVGAAGSSGVGDYASFFARPPPAAMRPPPPTFSLTPKPARPLVPSLETLCRICGYEGTHSLHQRIPFFVHALPEETTEWPNTIAHMISEIGGAEYGPITTDDKLPQRICTICISYMKHAIHFRNQALSNLRKCTQRLTSGFSTAPPTTSEEATVADVTKFFKSNCMPARNANNNAYNPSATSAIDTERLRRDIDDFFAEELTASASGTSATTTTTTTNSSSPSSVSSSDADDDDDIDDFNMETGQRRRAVISERQSRRLRDAIHTFFNYTETPFAEDDVNTMLGNGGAARIAVRQPRENARERKCYACKRQFLIHASYNDHVKQCVQVKLIEFVDGCQRMIQMHNERIVSEQEFIRRMVFAVKSITKSLAMCYRGVAVAGESESDPNKKTITKADVSKQMFDGKKDWWPEPPACPPKNSIRPPGMPASSATKVRSSKKPQLPPSMSKPPPAFSAAAAAAAAAAMAVMSPPPLPLFPTAPNASPVAFNPSRPPPPIAVLNNRIHTGPQPTSVQRAANKVTPHTPLSQLLATKVVSPTSTTAAATPTGIPKTLNIAASCSACQMHFGSIHDLETHNRVLHNGANDALPAVQTERRRGGAATDLLTLLRRQSANGVLDLQTGNGWN